MSVSLAKPVNFYVIVFETDRLCGGQEEGGWWYNVGEMLCYHEFQDKEEADAYAEELREGEFKGKGNLGYTNHRPGDTFEVWVSKTLVTFFPAETPRYS